MRRLLVITVLALPLLCSSWTASQAVENSASESLSTKDRIEILETVWKTINDEYYDPAFNGVNWSEVNVGRGGAYPEINVVSLMSHPSNRK